MNNQLDLTTLKIVGDHIKPDTPLENNSTSVSNCDVEVIFRDHKDRLLELIDRYSCVVGCVAWLTDLDILYAMTDMEHVSIVVQKEDFLRPDGNSKSFYADLRFVYEELPTRFDRYMIDSDLISSLSVCGDPSIDAIRCVGNHNSEKKPSFPRMHNKFLVFTDFHQVTKKMVFSSYTNYFLTITENACVWTGSYNISNTATKSFENAVVIHNQDVSEAYFREWAQVTALSEPLNWKSKWCEPEWRIGT